MNCQLVVVDQEQLAGELGIFAVVFGAAGDEGLAELLHRDRIDRIEGDPLIGLQEEDQIAGGLFQANADAARRVSLAQLGQPIVEGFGRGRQRLVLDHAGAGVDEVEIGFGVGAIQADDQVQRMVKIGCRHDGVGLSSSLPAGLTRRRQYRRVVMICDALWSSR